MAQAATSTSASLSAQLVQSIAKRSSLPELFGRVSFADGHVDSKLDTPEESEEVEASAGVNSRELLEHLPQGPSPDISKEVKVVKEDFEQVKEVQVIENGKEENGTASTVEPSVEATLDKRPDPFKLSPLPPADVLGGPQFTTSVRHSPHSTDLGMRSLAHQLVAPVKVLKESGSLSPWDAADLMTNADTLIHLAPQDRVFARDVLRLGSAFLDRAAASPDASIAKEVAVRDAVAFFAVLLKLYKESPYRAKKFIKVLQGGWYRKVNVIA
ncbi:hypothetical protein HDU96_002273 [Phlyctochytrium bullatum]|nr:hypothetical protein HDU96_002273 [Phlyctochytrium bullatum]